MSEVYQFDDREPYDTAKAEKDVVLHAQAEACEALTNANTGGVDGGNYGQGYVEGLQKEAHRLASAANVALARNSRTEET